VGRYDKLSPIIEKELVTLFEKEIHYHSRLEKMRQDIRMRYDYSPTAAFSAIDNLREN